MRLVSSAVKNLTLVEKEGAAGETEPSPLGNVIGGNTHLVPIEGYLGILLNTKQRKSRLTNISMNNDYA